MNYRLIKSFRCAWQGIKHCFCYEKNFRVQLFIALITFVCGLYFKILLSEWLTIAFFSALVLSLEMINTTIERLSNKICQSVDPIIKEVKDISAGAVFLSSILSFIVGVIIFLPKIKALFIK